MKRIVFAFLIICGLGGVCSESKGADPALPEIFNADNLLWEVQLGTHQYTVPKVDGGRIFLGVNDSGLQHPAVKRTRGGIFMCLDEKTGKMIWQLPVPRNMAGTIEPYHFNHWRCGICSTPAIDGKYLYIVSSRGEILCIDRRGQADGNDGPFTDELKYIKAESGYKLGGKDADIVWRFDLIEGADVVPHDVCGSSPVVLGDYVYACTSNGQDGRHRKVANPKAPSLVVLDKRTGKLAAVEGEKMGYRIVHGNWSSPIVGRFGGRDMVLFAGGDWMLYAFEPFKPNPRAAKPEKLKCIWRQECCPKEYRVRNGKPIAYSGWRSKSPDGPSEIISIPAVHDGKVYATIGQSPVHGRGAGALSCIDGATGKKVWENRKVGRSLANVLIHDGLAYVPDYSGKMHCIDAATGKSYWAHQMDAGVWTCSAVEVNGVILISTEKRRTLWAFKAGRKKTVVGKCRMQSESITPVIANGVMYFPTQKRIFALKIDAGLIKESKEKETAPQTRTDAVR
ncbi:MAG: PQQ-binding-like beta-propeller repeat protein [Phycisphaerae bacterium]|nr:PQQ-binding-like beta-propeller repeat protein [Phycisphaerae bacterium]